MYVEMWIRNPNRFKFRTVNINGIVLYSNCLFLVHIKLIWTLKTDQLNIFEHSVAETIEKKKVKNNLMVVIFFYREWCPFLSQQPVAMHRAVPIIAT